MDTELKDLVGKKVKRIWMDEEHLGFETDAGTLAYRVEGDCCSTSYFYDFYGVENLLEGGPVKEVTEVQLHPTDLVVKQVDDYEDIKVYGYQITVERERYGEPTEVTAVFSFRNSSNGYYGGSIEKAESLPEGIKEITTDQR